MPIRTDEDRPTPYHQDEWPPGKMLSRSIDADGHMPTPNILVQYPVDDPSLLGGDNKCPRGRFHVDHHKPGQVGVLVVMGRPIAYDSHKVGGRLIGACREQALIARKELPERASGSGCQDNAKGAQGVDGV